MKYARVLLLNGLLLGLPLWAGYAPIPEQEQGKAWSVSLRAGVVYDSNIFGAPSHEISSYDFSASP